ncbi:MAG: deoxyhypusine synthase, partial [Nostoc sp. NMS4]|nr:deoxyhypusine synthase [Nostoc sp. NMS4]
RREAIFDKLQKDYLAAKTRPSDQVPAAVAESASQQTATYPCGRLIPNSH